MEREELVSIGVITYNSCKTVKDTLDSIHNQTYQKLELIISDDGSNDNTIELCEEWLRQHKTRFTRVELLTVGNNTGTAANNNRALHSCRSSYVKLIAGDDILEPWCISMNMEIIGDSVFVMSDMVSFNEKNSIKVINNHNYLHSLAISSPQKRIKLFCRTLSSFNSPTFFVNKELYNKVGYFEEETGIIEDVSFFFRVISSDYKIVYLPRPTVRYREGGVSHNFDKIIEFQTKLLQIFNVNCKKELSWLNPIDAYALIDYKIWSVIVKNKHKFLLRLYLSRYNFIHKFKKTLSLLFINF